MKKSLFLTLIGLLIAMSALIVDAVVSELPGWALLTAAAAAALFLIFGFVCRRQEKKK